MLPVSITYRWMPWLSLRPGLNLKTKLSLLHFLPSTHSIWSMRWDQPVKFQQMEICSTATLNQIQLLCIPRHLADSTSQHPHDCDWLLSSIPEHDSPMLVLGAPNSHLDNPNSSDFWPLIDAFELKQVCSLTTYKAAKEPQLFSSPKMVPQIPSQLHLHTSVQSVWCVSLRAIFCSYPHDLLLLQVPQPVSHPLLLPQSLHPCTLQHILFSVLHTELL